MGTSVLVYLDVVINREMNTELYIPEMLKTLFVDGGF